jgi:hypothetical protein
MSGIKKAFKKVRKVLSKYDFGHQAAKGMGLPEPAGDLIYGKNKTLSPAEQAAADQKAQRDFAAGESRKQDLLNMQQSNMSKLAGLNSEKSTTQIEYGSTANEIADDLKRRKRKTTSGSSSVGIV